MPTPPKAICWPSTCPPHAPISPTRCSARVRAGQPPGALLGYRFERGLHENHPGLLLDVYIHRCRDLAPLTATRIDAAGQAVEPVTIGPVVDGLRLFRLWQQDGEGRLPE